MEKFYGSPRWSYEFLDCSMPMTFDQYNLCSYRCQYCFSYYQRVQFKDYLKKNIRWVNVEKVKKIFLDPDSSQFGPYIKKRIPLQWGGLSEPFDLAEPKLGIGLQLLKFFREIDYPVAFSTKSVWWPWHPEYRKVIKGAKNFHFKFTIITLDEEKARKVEQRVPSPQLRLKALEEVAKLGTAGVNLRLRPFIIGISTPSYLDLIKEAAKRGAQAVSTEFFCLDRRIVKPGRARYKIMSEACGFDLWEFYRLNSHTTGYLRLDYEVMRPYMEQMESLCKKLGIGFFVSDAHHKERCPWGSCCGLPKDKYFSNYAKCQFTEAIVIAKEKGEVRFSDIAKNEHEFLEKTLYVGAGGLHSVYREKNYFLTMLDVMRSVWNNPKDGHSPYKYFEGMLIPDRLDENGDIVYKFNRKKHEGK